MEEARVRDKFSRMTLAIAICEEFAQIVDLHPTGRIVTMIHSNWMFALENRLRQCHWRFIRIGEVGPFRILTLVDSWR